MGVRLAAAIVFVACAFFVSYDDAGAGPLDPIIAIDLNIQQNQPQPPSITLPIWNSTYDWPNGHGYNTWTQAKQTALPDGYELRQGYGKPGLWLWPKGSFALGGLLPKLYPPGYAEFSYAAPGTTRIARARLETEYRSSLYATHCTEFGLRTGTTSRAKNRDCTPPVPDRIEIGLGGEKSFRKVALFDPLGAPTAKDLYARIEIPKCPLLPDSACSKLVAGGDPLNGGAYLRTNKISLTLVDDDLPVVMTSGVFYDLKDKYIDGEQSYALHIADTDAGAGIKHTQLDHTKPTPPGTTNSLGSKPASCDPANNTAALGSRICPQADSLALTVDTNPFPEGTNKLRAWAADPANNVGEKRFSVIVDRTAPEAPNGIYFLTPVKGSAQVYWDEAKDPVLADGTRPSGTSHYRFRHKVNDGAWSTWSQVSRSRQLSSEVVGQPAGTTVTFEVVAVDAVGNASLPATMTGVVHDPDEVSPTGGSGTPDDLPPDVSAPVSDEGAEAQDSSPTKVPTGAVPISLSITNGDTPPAITPPIWNSSYLWQQGVGYSEWTPNVGSTLTNGYELKRGHAGRPGLWIWPVGSSAAGNKLYPPGYVEFAFTAPGTTRIARASVDLAYRSSLYASHCTEIGLRTATETRAANTNCLAPLPSQVVIDHHGETSYRNVPLFDPSSSPTTKEAYARIFIPSCQLFSIELCSKVIPSQDPLHFGPYLQVRGVSMTLVDDDRPAVETAGSFSDLNGKYVNGSQNYQLATSESDAGAGIASTQIDHVRPAPSSQTSALSTKPAACDPAHNTAALGSRICPQTDSLTIPVDTTTFPEGRSRIRVWSTDPAGNVGEKKLSVIVDRTAPSAPKVKPLKSDEGSAQVYWDESVDPALPDGTRGSTTVSYRFRSKVNDGNWTDWKEVPRSQQISDEIFDKPIGTVVSFEVTAVDAVGNVSAASAVSITVRGKLPTNAIGGELGALDGKYTQGRSPVVATVTGTDDEAGVDIVSLSSPSAPFSTSVAAPCGQGQQRFSDGKRDCPKLFTPDISVPLQDFPEGRHTFTSATNGRATNTSSSSVSLIIDRSMPAVPANSLTAAYDDDDVSASVGFDVAEDPLLPGDILGSGIVRASYRFRHSGNDSIEMAAWSDWADLDAEGFSYDGAIPGETIQVEVQTFDAVGNSSTVHRMEAQVASNACFADEGGRDHWGREIHAGILNQQFDSITFVNPVTQSQLLNALPSTANVLAVLTRTYTHNGGVHSSAMSQMDGSLSSSLQSMNDKLIEEIDAQTAQMEHYIQSLPNGPVRTSYEISVDSLQERKSLYISKSGAPIKSISIAANAAVRSQIVSAFPGNVDAEDYGENEATESCSGDGFVETSSDASGGAVPTAMINAVSLPLAVLGVTTSQSKTTAGDGMNVPSTDVDADNPASRFAPKYVRVYAGKRTNGRFITARWRWNSGNTSYWRDQKRKVNPNRGRDQRGAEIQVRMDLEHPDQDEGDGSWGKPAWGEEDPTTGSGGNVDANLISATNISCPYPDDYNNPFFNKHELQHRYNLTVGQGCRPGPKRALSSWTHWLAKGPDENGVDRIGVQVDAMHRGKDDHSKKYVGVEAKSELDWCNEHSRAMGSCIFTDHTPSGVQSRKYGGTMLTPSASDNGTTTTEVFER